MKRIAIVLLSSLILHPSSFAQGPLTPPGPPAPTMKTLDQIEPRTPVTNLPTTITAAGSYYLSTNLTGASGSSGISIAASDVTLDLNGFTLIGISGSLSGITVSGTTNRNLSVRNGTVRNWGASGVAGSGASNSQLRDLRSLNNGTAGLSVGSASLIINCIATSNTSTGIVAGTRSTIIGCTSVSNSFAGVRAGDGSAVRDCTVAANTDVGIVVSGGCEVLNNLCDLNLNTGIRADGGKNRIEGNHVRNRPGAATSVGIASVTATNLIIRNSVAAEAGTSFSTANGDLLGTVEVTPSGMNASKNPHANFEF